MGYLYRRRDIRYNRWENDCIAPVWKYSHIETTLVNDEYCVSRLVNDHSGRVVDTFYIRLGQIRRCIKLANPTETKEEPTYINPWSVPKALELMDEELMFRDQLLIPSDFDRKVKITDTPPRERVDTCAWEKTISYKGQALRTNSLKNCYAENDCWYSPSVLLALIEKAKTLW